MPLPMVSHSAPALVLTQSPRDLMPLPRDMLLMLILAMPTMASVMLRLTPLFCTLDMLDTHMPPSMVLSPMPLLPPPLDLSTLPTLVSAPTTLELLFLAKQFHPKFSIECLQLHLVSQNIMKLPKIGTNTFQN